MKQIADAGGRGKQGVLEAIIHDRGDAVVVRFDHPLVGKRICFKVKILEIS